MNIIELFIDWIKFRLSQKQRDLKMTAQVRARSAAFGGIRKTQEGLKNKIKGRKGKAEVEDDED